MTSEEIIQKLRERDEKVTQCFFFWKGPSMAHIEEVRRTDFRRAARMPKPICNSCRPGILQALHKLYGSEHFDYDELVSDFYLYLMKDDKLASIKDPDKLMGWIVTAAYFYFLHEKKKRDKVLENTPMESLNNVSVDIEQDESASAARRFVDEVLSAMPNRTYAKILDEVTLETWQYKGREKAEKLRQLSERLDFPIDNLYVKISLAKKQFKDTARKLNLI
jgi:hypothetical protein